MINSRNKKKHRDKNTISVAPFKIFLDRIAQFIYRLEYQNNYKFRVSDAYETFNQFGEWTKADLSISRNAPHADDHTKEIVIHGKGAELFSTETTKEWLGKAWDILKELEDHERDEFFRYNGSKVNNPHRPGYKIRCA